MADIKGFLQALTALSLIHPYGHVQYGDTHGTPTSIDWGKQTEVRDTNDAGRPVVIDPEHPGQIENAHSDVNDVGWNSAGFGIQDKLTRATSGTPDNENMHLANAAYKMAYVLGLPRLTAAGENMATPNGDIGEMERISGNKYTRHLLGFAALADLIKSQRPEQTWDVSAGPMPNTTAMGLTFTKRF